MAKKISLTNQKFFEELKVIFVFLLPKYPDLGTLAIPHLIVGAQLLDQVSNGRTELGCITVVILETSGPRISDLPSDDIWSKGNSEHTIQLVDHLQAAASSPLNYGHYLVSKSIMRYIKSLLLRAVSFFSTHEKHQK